MKEYWWSFGEHKHTSPKCEALTNNSTIVERLRDDEELSLSICSKCLKRDSNEQPRN